MTAQFRRSVVVIALLGSPLLAYRVEAGRFVFPVTCDTTSVEPLRLRVGLLLYDRWFTPLCKVALEPRSVNGSDIVPIRSCTAPGPLSCRVIPETGAAVIEAAPCLGAWSSFRDSLSIEIDQPVAHFQAKLFIDESEYFYAHHLLSITCDPSTPVLPATWGEVKATYR